MEKNLNFKFFILKGFLEISSRVELSDIIFDLVFIRVTLEVNNLYETNFIYRLNDQIISKTGKISKIKKELIRKLIT
ncbi:MAG: hypothetical protein G8D24_01540 [Buchnera aphidicola (Periphyllus lyropictus)]|uniref:hypothetical protein n=1 Tax=Buchnera aphidicola TaxID=9 RepID=UPI001EB5791D|nr:hypothetical protein [Buchnera aphidicola (Periphyllus lyropictus)]